MDKKIPSLDGLRAVSILLVILSHLSYALPKPFFTYITLSGLGPVGVTMFFVISGYLITTLLLKEKFSHHGTIDIKRFYIRRAFRILPVSFLYISMICLLNNVFALGIKGTAFCYALTYTVNFMAPAASPKLLGHLWSLGIEEQFYLFWPWITRRSLRVVTALAFIIIAYAPAVRVITYVHPELRLVTLAPFFEYSDALMIGCLLAISRYAFPDFWKSSILGNRYLRLLSVFIIWLVPFLEFIDSKHFHADYFTVLFGTTVISLGTAYIIASTTTFKSGKMFRFLNTPVIAYIGVLSYSIYIWQQIFLRSMVIPNLPAWWRSFPLNVVLTFCAAIASYHLWEKGFLKLKDRFRVV